MSQQLQPMTATTQPTGALATATAAPQQLLEGLSAPATFQVVLDVQRQQRALDRLNATQVFEMPTQEIALIGVEAATELNKTLDGFLSRVDQQNSPQLFSLIEQLGDKVAEEDLPALAERIRNAKPPLMARLLGVLNAKKLRDATNRAVAEVSRSVQGKSKNLSTVVLAMEQQLRGEMTRLADEVRHMEAIKASYRHHFESFAEEALFLHSLVVKAREEFVRREPELKQDVQRYHEAQDKLQALESRALAVEGTFTRLPADHEAIRLLQNAGVATLQELATTAQDRFASIRMSLIKLQGADLVKGVQRLAAQGAALDANLNKIGNQLMAEVTTTAMNAAGDNRVAQADQVASIVATTKELRVIAQTARDANTRKFQEAREKLSKSRQELLELDRPAPASSARAY